ncbi:probable serine hydrolase [Periplaneta americana]|uniref:probable serine hydrolase n=1 Tax=Periplaneta americana TaxID=6978 RepID=UPI0037E915B6
MAFRSRSVMLCRVALGLQPRNLSYRPRCHQICRYVTVSHEVEKPFQEVQIPVPWGYVAGKWWGDQNVQPVLGLHGWDDNCATFDTLAPLLNLPSFLTVDIMGHGMSSYFPIFGASNFMDAVILLRRIVNYFEWNKISIVGHSFGSAMGFTYAGIYPDDVEKLVGIECARSLLSDTQPLLERLRDTMEQTLAIEEKMVASDPPDYTIEELVDKMYEGRFKSVTRESCAVLLRRGMKKSEKNKDRYYLSRDPRVKPSWIGCAQDEQLMELARRMKCKVLSVRGKQGFLLSGAVERVYVQTLKEIKQCEHHDVDGSHHLHLNNPENVAPLINKFFSV